MISTPIQFNSVKYYTTYTTILSMLIVHDIISCSVTSESHPPKNTIVTSSNRAIKLTEIAKALHNNCLNAERDLDRCSAQLIGFGQSDAEFPSSMEELNSAFCPKFRQTVECIKNSTDCYKPFEKQIINWILTSTRRMNYKRCRNENEKQRFLRLTSSCLRTMRHTMDDCMANYISGLEGVADFDDAIERLTEEDKQIQLACCANRRFKQCVMKQARQSCQPVESLRMLKRTNSLSSQRVVHKHAEKATLETMDNLKSTLDGMALTGPEFICSGVDERFCRINYDGKFGVRSPRSRSVVPAMIKIYSNKK